ncbi:hypothetical protein [Streptosporangium sp. NPDC023615]|uniref:hypothetical protein n=1 Tax=Streptosporangium sp. NPDC023615 TaxID=3154794 RepID=UPI00341D98A0
MIDYNGRRFTTGGVPSSESHPIALYRQHGDLLWGEFSGGHARRGSLTGLCAPDGTLDFAYTMVLDTGAVVSGHCRSTPELLPDGRVLLHETWERFGAHASRGVSLLEEIDPATSGETARTASADTHQTTESRT